MPTTDTHEKERESVVASGLVQRIIQGDNRAENDMVERYHRALLIMLKQRSQDPFLADDIAQDTWQKVIEKVREGELRDHAKLGAFIMQIGRNLLIMSYRSNGKRRNQLDVDEVELEDQSSKPECRVNTAQIISCVKEALAEMATERDREILSRYYIHEEEKETICESLELTDAHFYRVLHRARNRFRDLWLRTNEV